MDRLVVIFAIVVHATVAGAVTFAVDVGPPSWEARALAAALAADLEDNELHAGAPAEVFVRGELVAGELRYAIVSRAGIARGAIALAGDRRAVAGALRDELHRLVRPHDAAVPGPPAEVAEPALEVGAFAGIAVVLALLAVPLVLVRRIWGFAAGAVVAIALVAMGDRLPELSPAVFLAGGLAWGVFVAVIAPIAVPPLPGLHRAEHGGLVPALVAWLAVTVQRLVAMTVVLVAAGFGLAAYADAIELPAAIAFGVVAPIVGLAAWLAIRAVIERCARSLDRELVADTAAQAWHAHVRAYFVGYRRRANLDVDDQILERIAFLPGREADVTVYGGERVRVVMPLAMLEHALAPYGRPHDYQTPRVSTLHWTHWNQGLVMPTEPGAKLASQADRTPSATVDDGEHERMALGEPPTLSGIIEPQAFDPRKSYRPGEDPLWLDWDPGEEYDGTDAGDKDYLFGVLVLAEGAVQRHEVGAHTVALWWRRRFAHARWAQLGARLVGPLRGFAARRSAALGDVHAALGGARHHLAQYLAWQLWHRESFATARAYVPVHEQTSRAIAAALSAELDADPRHVATARRLAALTGTRASRTRRQRLVLACAGLAALGIVLALVVEAVAYHATYEDRMATEASRGR